ncbi:hypothetical protein [Gracilibacillus sp. YIM 98692]|uniref:hypothetical protein n=1 Tax=Gracilibacillus sp. YIM 98692 TaxID=2663532 RepID=UPI0013D10793|nr:hypothetical protein [Gracilibacillus sp. YIM 98692]
MEFEVGRIIVIIIGISLLILGIKHKKDHHEEPYKPIKMGKAKYDEDAEKSVVGLSLFGLLSMFP